MKAFAFALAAAAVLLPHEAVASVQYSLPWEGTFRSLTNSLTGPVVQYGSAAAVASTGLALAFNEGGPIVRSGVKGAFGLSVATGAASLVASLWGVSPGAVF